MMDEPAIVINGTCLTDAQAMAVRVAVTQFHMETATNNELGEIGVLYHARLAEILKLMIG